VDGVAKGRQSHGLQYKAALMYVGRSKYEVRGTGQIVEKELPYRPARGLPDVERGVYRHCFPPSRTVLRSSVVFLLDRIGSVESMCCRLVL
jgi:hypothetical protein